MPGTSRQGVKHEVLEYSDDWKVLGDHHAG